MNEPWESLEVRAPQEHVGGCVDLLNKRKWGSYCYKMWVWGMDIWERLQSYQVAISAQRQSDARNSSDDWVDDTTTLRPEERC